MIKAKAKMNNNGTVGIDVIIDGDAEDIACEMCGIICEIISRLEEVLADGVTTDEVIDSIAKSVKATLNERSETE